MCAAYREKSTNCAFFSVQVLMILFSTIIFKTEVTPLNGAGIAIVLLGSARYSYVSVIEQQKPPPHRTQSMKRDLSDAELGQSDDVESEIEPLAPKSKDLGV
jgi:hypothetical protein